MANGVQEINTAMNPAFVISGKAITADVFTNLPDPATVPFQFAATTTSPKQLFFSNGLAWWAIAALE
jgi:hypothetical protein